MLNEEHASEELKEILSGREYMAYQNNEIATWREQLIEWLTQRLEDLFPSINISKDFSGSVLTFIIVITVILLLLLIFFLVRQTAKKKSFHRNKPLQIMDEIQWSYNMHLSEAEKCETLEEYTRATRHMFLALLLYFHEKEWLIARIWKTNWEYYDELKKVNLEAANQFYHLALIFDEVTYGERQLQKQEYMKFKHDTIQWIKGLKNKEKGGMN